MNTALTNASIFDTLNPAGALAESDLRLLTEAEMAAVDGGLSILPVWPAQPDPISPPRWTP